MLYKKLILLTLLVLTAYSFNQAKAEEKKVLTLDNAKKIAAASVQYAKKNNAPGGAIAIVDDGGHLIYLERLDNTFPAASKISVGKARTAATFRKPTKVFEELINKGRTTMVTLEDFTPLQGGIPLVIDGDVGGGIGVSGAASAQQDEEIAIAGAEALKSVKKSSSESITQATVYYAGNKKVTEAFKKGAPLLEVDEFKVHASRRDEPGEAEIHNADIDIFYILEGKATFVTGGEIVEGKETAHNEIRGPNIKGGENHTLSKGDLIIIPKGTPHWFKDVKTTFVYYVVKVSDA